MKKILPLTLIILSIASNVFSQCDDLTRQTPLGTNVKACSSGGYSQAVVNATDQYTRSYAIEVFDNGTNDYNCHGYAWHVDYGGDEVWINNLYTEAENINNYWEDGSYIELNSQPSSTAHVKVFYGSNDASDGYDDDHSAVTTSNSNVFISKMGCGVLCSHLKSNSPYDNSDLRYFSLLKMDASTNIVCYGSTATFTTPDYVNCTFNWTYNTNLLNYVSGQGTKTFVVEPKTSTSCGEAWVKLELTIDLDVTREITKTVWVGTPDHDNISITGDDWVVPKNSIFMATASEEMYIDDYQWDLPYGFNITMGQGTYTIRFNAPSGFGSDYYGLQLHNTCGTSGRNYMMYEAPFKSVLIVSPNPTSGETTVSIEPEVTQDEFLKSTSTETTLDENTEWDIEVYDNMQSLKLKKQKLKGKSTRIGTQSWKEGVYMVRVKYNGEILTGKLIVK
ncbi:T9SS type A sorting domain-containing protein [uncultured Draconibacterium sp.]|nr:T9SS type A sorting domain-containing protein [uncultured Draconibacterium sp.]